MLDSIIGLIEFSVIFIAACILLIKCFHYVKELTIGKDGLSVKFDFYIDTKSEPTNPNEWTIIKVGKHSNELTSLSLEDFKYFVMNNVWKQIPLSENDVENFCKIRELYEKSMCSDEGVFKKFWQRNYLFNIKFEQISKMVKEYRITWAEVMSKESVCQN